VAHLSLKPMSATEWRAPSNDAVAPDPFAAV
jgi:hypothetical protein